MMSWQLDMGATIINKDQVRFRVWAPHAKKVSLKIVAKNAKLIPMIKKEDDCFEVTVLNLSHPIDYFYLLDDKTKLPDPVSRFQPRGVHGPSRVIDPNFKWEDQEWKGISIYNLRLYELHVGTFTKEGTYKGLQKKLSYLKSLGITAISLMPIVQFSGNRGWGYDGTFPYAPHRAYGKPHELKQLINACHKMNLAVVLDVVYNHLGPDGNHIGAFGPYFTDRYHTPWGDAMNFDGAYSNKVREYFIENALYWLSEFHVDGLRLDAVQEIYDRSANHFLFDLRNRFHQLAKKIKRKAHLIAESDLNNVLLINPKEMGGYNLDAQWNDDYHHALFSYFSKATHTYFSEFGSLKEIKKAIEHGYVYDGSYSNYRKKYHGNSSKERPGWQFVNFLQNHDQIANASFGKRMSTYLTFDQQKVATMLLMISPSLPMLFMGQEWGATSQFCYFTSFKDEKLAKAVQEGYQKEYPHHLIHGHKLNPQAKEVYTASKINWSEKNRSPHKQLLQFHRDLQQIKELIETQLIYNKEKTDVEYRENNPYLILYRSGQNQEKIVLVCNLSDIDQNISFSLTKGTWNVLLDTNAKRYSVSNDNKRSHKQLSIKRQTIVTDSIPGNSALLFANF